MQNMRSMDNKETDLFSPETVLVCLHCIFAAFLLFLEYYNMENIYKSSGVLKMVELMDG